MATKACAHRIGLLLFVAQCLSANISHAFVSDCQIRNKRHLCVSPGYIHEPLFLFLSPVDVIEGDNNASDYSEDGDDHGYDEHAFDESNADDDDENDGEEEDEPYLGSYARNDEWLEEATATVLDLKKLPLGALSPEDISSICGIMSAWVKRCSVEACLTVEKLLKRVVDDMRAGNPDAYVTARMYTIVSTVVP